MGRDYSRLRYWIDWAGRLWKGPVHPDENLHYAVFGGFTIHDSPHQIWTLERTEEPEEADEISSAVAEKIIARYRKER